VSKSKKFTRRDVLKAGTAAGALLATEKVLACAVDSSPIPIEDIAFTTCGVGGEPMATSPFIVNPYQDAFVIPRAMRPGWRTPDTGSGSTLLSANDPSAWFVRKSVQFGNNTIVRPGPAPGQQDALGDRPGVHADLGGGTNPWGIPNAGTHQLWTSGPGVTGQNLNYPDPILLHIRLQVNTHSFTTSPVVPIDSGGNAVVPPSNAGTPVGNTNGTLADGVFGAVVPTYALPPSTIYGFNGTFPGPMINIQYGRPVLVRFENDLDLNPYCRDRQDFGAPDWAFLTHLHNGHTAPESDGQPHHLGADHGGGYQPTEWCDNLYLAYPAGGDDREKQSFLWFHDHRMHHTGPNVYKGMVGIAPHYDPILDSGDETTGLRLPGVRHDNGDGTFDVDYDIPMVFYDCRLDDGITPHQDEHTPVFSGQYPQLPANQFCGNTHPEWWGQLFHRHYPNHGFVGDIFTVNGVAYPVLVVQRRKYRFRFLDASVSRQYSLSIRSGTPMPFPGRQGQWNFGVVKNGVRVDDKGLIAFNWFQIASEGGLLPFVQQKSEIEIWPAKRREAIVDFTVDANGKKTVAGAVYYLCDTAQMLDGRKQNQSGDPGFDAQTCVPLVKIVLDGTAVDNSLMPANKQLLRASPPFDPNAQKVRDFTLQRGGTAGGETEWLINGLQFDPFAPLATPFIGAAEAWGINNGGGGWTHPMHLHMEEHHVIFRSTNLQVNSDDTGKEDVVALQPSEQTVIYRRFRTFLGNYVAHCHNLAHEDHNMMFGWSIIKQ
jgi:FtsP/CotA-like multicopper oxidase with cupredoxin domain